MLKTSQEWQGLVEDLIVVEDPDGWDRSSKGWLYSWYHEKITWNEFEKRLSRSTCLFKKPIMEIVEEFKKRF